MRRSLPVATVAAITSAGLLLAGCSGKGSSDSSAGANAATKGVVNASDEKGGTLTYAMSDAPESFDPGNTYYAFVYNFSRLYARPLTTFKPGAGTKGEELVPDLAESMGKASDGGKTWTYKLRKGVKFEDGKPVTSQDVKYAVERSNFARDTLSLGPNYFQQFLQDNDGGYKGPYKDKGKEGLKSIETPDAQTIVFHLNKPFAEFDYLVSAPQTAPVPQAQDKGADYTKHVMSTGSYKFESYQEGKQLTLVRNPQWSAATDPLRKQLPDKIVLNLKVAQSTIDKDLQSGNTMVDMAGRGVDGQTQAQLLTDPTQKSHTDNALGQRLVYTAINTTILARNDRQDEIDAATSVIGSLKKIGINAKIQSYPTSKYFSDYAGVPEFDKSNNVGLMMMQWGADFPTGYGYLQQILNGKAISQSGNSNLSQLDDPEINKLLDGAIANTDQAAREKAYGDIDRKAMEQAAIVPLTYFKVLMYRSPKATNLVSTSAFSGEYDYLNIGVKK